MSEKQKQGWGNGIVPKLSKELQKEFPGVSGFSKGSRWLMAQFYNEYQSDIKQTCCYFKFKEVQRSTRTSTFARVAFDNFGFQKVLEKCSFVKIGSDKGFCKCTTNRYKRIYLQT